MRHSRIIAAFFLAILLLSGHANAAQLTAPIEDLTLICEGGQITHCKLLFNVDVTSLGIAQIDHAEVVIFPSRRFVLPMNMTFYLFPITQGWNPASVGWGFPWSEPGGDVDSTLVSISPLFAGTDASLRADVTSIVRSWVNERIPNCGILASKPESEGAAFGPEIHTVGPFVSEAYCRIFYTQVGEPGPEPAIKEPEVKNKID